MKREGNQMINELPVAYGFPMQKKGSSHPRLNSSAEIYNTTLKPEIQEHKKCAQLSPGKGYLIVNEPEYLIYCDAICRKRQGEKCNRISTALLLGEINIGTRCAMRSGSSAAFSRIQLLTSEIHT